MEKIEVTMQEIWQATRPVVHKNKKSDDNKPPKKKVKKAKTIKRKKKLAIYGGKTRRSR
jgi:hypothetical protein